MNKNILIMVMSVTLLAGAVALILIMNKPKTGYVLIEQVYSNFDFKKELEKKYDSIKMERKKIIDSLEMNLRLAELQLRKKKSITDIEAQEFDSAKQVFFLKSKQMNEDNASLSAQYDKQILTQLNQYIKNYGTENGYEYIFGNDNNGSLMYADNTHNISDEVTKYVNAKYNGIK
jgi:outer membrane protein